MVGFIGNMRNQSCNSQLANSRALAYKRAEESELGGGKLRLADSVGDSAIGEPVSRERGFQIIE